MYVREFCFFSDFHAKHSLVIDGKIIYGTKFIELFGIIHPSLCMRDFVSFQIVKSHVFEAKNFKQQPSPHTFSLIFYLLKWMTYKHTVSYIRMFQQCDCFILIQFFFFFVKIHMNRRYFTWNNNFECVKQCQSFAFQRIWMIRQLFLLLWCIFILMALTHGNTPLPF